MSSDNHVYVPELFSLVFEDNFDDIGGQPNEQDWTYDLGDGSAQGIPSWGNGEDQIYTDDPANVTIVDTIASGADSLDTDHVADNTNGALKIVANKTGQTITSARVKSDIEDLGAYGYYEIRAKLPAETGAWPAIWLLGQDGPAGWPDTGEIDLVEWSANSFGTDGTQIISAFHYRGDAPQGSNESHVGGTTLGTTVEDWHTYQVWWSPDEVRIGVDGNIENAHLSFTKAPEATNDHWPFDHPMDLIMNIAIGGNLGGAYDTTQDFNYEMLVDYVRVYQGDWTATNAGPDYVAAAEGVTALMSDVYAVDVESVWAPSWLTLSTYDGVVEGARKYTDVTQIVIEPATPVDISGTDMVHLSVFRTDASADLIVKLVNFTDGAYSNGTTVGSVTLAAGTGDAVEVGRWVDLAIPKSAFGLSVDDHIGQFIVESYVGGTTTGSEETVYLKEVYVSDTSVAGPATDAGESTGGLKNVVVLQGDENTVDVGTNFLSNGHASTTTSTVTLGGDKHVQKYESTVWLQITPDQPIDITDLTTLHMSVYRTGGQLDNWGGSDLKVVLVYDNGTEDAYWFSDTRGDEAVPDQWNHLELPLAWMANSQAAQGLGVTDIIFVPERHPYTNANTYETLYLDNLSFSAKVNPDVPQDPPPAPLDDPQDVISIYSDTYSSDVAEFDPLYRWSVVTEPGQSAVGTPLEQDVTIGDQGAILYQGVGMVAMMFSEDKYGYPAAERLDVSSMDTLKLSVFRSDPHAQLKFALRYDDGSNAGEGVESSSIYFDAGTSYGAVPAGHWHMIEIPLSDFTMPNPNYTEGESDPEVTPAEVPVDLTQVTGLMMWSFDAEYEARTDEQGQMLDAGYAVTTDPDAQAYDPVPSRETIYVDEFYFSKTPDAPRRSPEDPVYDPATVVASVIGDVYTDDAVGSTPAMGSPSYVQGLDAPVLKFADTTGLMMIGLAQPVTVSGADAQTQPLIHLDVWRDDPGVPADLHLMLMNGDGTSYVYQKIPSAEVPVNQWTTLQIPVTEGITVQNILMGLGVPDTGNLLASIPPTAVNSDGLYIGNLFFSDGSLASPPFVAPTGFEFNFAADQAEGLVVEGFGAGGGSPSAAAAVKASPNGDPALEVVKTSGSVDWAGVSIRYPEAENKISLVTQETPFVVMDILAPAAGETVRLEMQDSDDNTVKVFAEVTTTHAGWQTVRFDFTGQIDPDVDYDKTVFFPSYGADGTGQTYFLDDVRFLDAVPNAVPAFADDGVTVEVSERDTVVYTADAPDPDVGAVVKYSLEGADKSLFTIDEDTGEVVFVAAPDYETPGSAAGSNSYSFSVVADDGVGGVSSQAVTVNVTDIREIVVTSEAAPGADRKDPNVLTVDDVQKGPLELIPGTKVILDFSAVDYPDDFGLSLSPDGTHAAGGVIYDDTNVVIRDNVNHIYTIFATEEVPQLYYYDDYDSGLGGSITTPVVLTVTAANQKYYIDGVEQAYVDLDPGRLYKFDVSDSSMGSHPFRLSTTADGTEYAGTGYTRAADGTVTLAVTEDTPTLYYYCDQHTGMGGAMSLFPATPTGGEVIDFEGFTSNGDGTYALDDAQFESYGTHMGRGLVTIKEEDGVTDRVVLKLQKDAGTEWWSGVRLANELTGSDLIGDGTDPITMRVYAEQAGSLSLELWVGIAGTGPYTVTQTVEPGWNSLSFDVSGADASLNWDTIELRPDAAGGSGTQAADAVYFIDDVHLPQATISDTVVTVPPTPTGGVLVDFEGHTSNGDGTYALGNSDYTTYGTAIGRGVSTKKEIDGVTERVMLEVQKAQGTEWWSGVTLFDDYRLSDLVGDGTQPVTMRVYAEQAGNLNLEFEALVGEGAATPFIVNKEVDQGWSTVQFDLTGIDTSVNWHRVQLRPDAKGKTGDDTQTATTKYYIDDLHFPQGSLTAWPADPTGAAFLTGATPPDEAAADVVSLYSDGYTSALAGVGLSSWSGGTMTEQTIDANNKVQKFEKTSFAGFDVPGAVTVDGMDTLSISVWRTEDTRLEIKLVDGGGDTSAYYVPASDMPKGQWSTVEVPLTSFMNLDQYGNVTTTPMDANQPVDQVVLKPMGGPETFYVDDFVFLDSGTTETGGTGGSGGSGGGVTATIYDDTDVTHLGIAAETASAVSLTIGKTGDHQLTVTVESTNSDAVGNVLVSALPAGTTHSVARVDNGVASIDIIWNNPTVHPMPADASFNVLWSKVSNPALQWMLYDATALGSIDTSYVAQTGGGATPTSPDTAATFALGANDSAVYMDAPVNVLHLDPDWGQSTALTEVTDTEAGKLLKFSNFNYQGIEFANRDVTGQDDLHLDVWSATTGKIKVGPVSRSTGEHLIEFDVTGGQWNAIDLDLVDFANAGVVLTDVFQIKFDTGSVPVTEFYVDNLAFTAPYVAPSPSPATEATFSLDGDDAAVYTGGAPVNVTNLDPNWDGGTGTVLSEVGGNLKLSNFNFQGIEIVDQDVSGKEHLHLDVWSANSGKIKLGLVSRSTGEHLIEFDVTGGQWNAIDLDLVDFATAGIDLTDVFQLKFDTVNADTPKEFYLDNLAFTGTNDAPVLSAAAESGSGDEDHVITGQLAAATDSGDYHYVVVTDVGSGTLTLDEDGSYVFDPGTDFDDLAVGETRDVSFSYAAVDEQGAQSAPKTVTLTVDGVNDAPVLTAPGPDISGHENEVLSGLLDAATDVDGSVSYRLIAGPDNGGTATIQADGTYGFDPGTDFDDLEAGETRVSSFRYEAIDADGGVSAEWEEVTVTVTGTNDAPTISTATETGTVAEGASILNADLADYTDPDDVGVVYEVASYPAEGSLSVHPDGTYTFIAGPDFDDLGVGQSRDVSFSYRAVDGLDAESAPKTVTITVTGTNDEPTLAVVADQTVGQNSAAVLIDVLAGSTDIDGDNLSIVAVSSQQGATVTVDDGKISYQPATDFTGTDTVEYRVTDGTVQVEATITVNVPVNQAPEFGNDQGYLINEKRSDEEDGWSWSHQATAVDPDGDGLAYTLGGADGGDFAISGTGEVTFNEAPDYESGKTQYNFTVTASDGTLSDVQNVTVDIMNVDEVVTLGSAELSSGGTFAGEDLEDVLDGSSATVSLDMAGGGGDDTLTGGSAGDVLDGGAGDDILDGGDGNDVIITGGGLDRVYGGDGIDTVVMDSTVNEIQSVSLARKWQYSDDGWSYIEGVENVTTGAGTDIIQGSGDANVLDSGSGDDMLYAGGGDDTLVGGAGTDLLDGGDGNDTVVYETSDNLVVDLSSEWQVGNLNTSEGMDKLIDIENVTTGAGNDTLVGNADANVLDGGDGDDTLAGGAGNDQLTGGDGADVFRFYASEGMTTDVITDFSVGEDTIELVNDTTDIIGDAVITTDANGSTVTWDELTIVLDVVVTKDDINPIVS